VALNYIGNVTEKAFNHFNYFNFCNVFCVRNPYMLWPHNVMM